MNDDDRHKAIARGEHIREMLAHDEHFLLEAFSAVEQSIMSDMSRATTPDEAFQAVMARQGLMRVNQMLYAWIREGQTALEAMQLEQDAIREQSRYDSAVADRLRRAEQARAEWDPWRWPDEEQT